jgi:hypothetical protein
MASVPAIRRKKHAALSGIYPKSTGKGNTRTAYYSGGPHRNPKPCGRSRSLKIE